MASGDTTTSVLADSLPTILDSARIVFEYPGVLPELAENHTLREGTGLSWEEVSYSQLTAQSINEATILDNPQQLVDTLLTVTPQQRGVMTRFTDRVQRRIFREGWAQVGQLAGNAIARLMDEDGFTTIDGAGTSQPGAGSTLTFGVISAFGQRVRGNATEPASGPIYAVLHPFQVYDLWSDVTGGVGTYPVPAGMTSDALRDGFKMPINGVQVFEDGNISIDSSDDSKGGVFPKMGLLLIKGYDLRREVNRRPDVGGGADELFIYAEWAYGERSASNWIHEVYSDATAPTS